MLLVLWLVCGVVRGEAADWLWEAWADLRHAERSLSLGDYNWACFAAQQAAEKALKAFFIAVLRRRPPHIHDLTVLYGEVSGELELSEDVTARLGRLSSYYVVSRYPNAGVLRPSRGVSRVEAEDAIRLAKEVVEAASRRLGFTPEG